MTTTNFDKRVLIEQVRYIEAKHPHVSTADAVSVDVPQHGDFEERLWQRANRLVTSNDLHPILGHAARLSHLAGAAALIVAGVLGALAIVYAVTGSQTINIYWLLLLLLGFNLLSMSLWLIGISLDLKGLLAGALAKLTVRIPGYLKNASEPGIQADHAWLACHFGGDVGKWQLSRLTHQLWLVYLFAGLAAMVLILMARQYDFVWGTTLLSDTTFVNLTDTLSVPLQALGFTTPTAEQVQETRIGVAHALTAAHRSGWAQFLLGSLLCFGIAPRLLLWGWSMLMYMTARRRFALDYYLPYYIGLRQQLMPLAGHGEVIDADTSPPGSADSPNANPVAQSLPPAALWVSVELGDDISWPPLALIPDQDLGQVIDRASLTRILHSLKGHEHPEIAIAVEASRPPDRGVQRTITSLLSNSAQRWLVLLLTQDQNTVSPTRLAAWYRLAKACQVPADHVISLRVT